MPTYLKLTGVKQGRIKGSVTQKGREGLIEVHSLDHAFGRPDPAAPLATGRLVHGALRLTKRIDKSSPLLYAALVANEAMTECVVDFWVPQMKAVTGTASEVLAYRIKLTGAVVTGVGLTLADLEAPPADKRRATEAISLAYESIEWTWLDGGITASATR